MGGHNMFLKVFMCMFNQSSGYHQLSRKFISKNNVLWSQTLIKEASNQAVLCHKVKEPLKLEDFKDTKLKKSEVRIKVQYCALNPRDLLLIEGAIPAKMPLVPGYEVSGEVVEKIKSDTDDSSDLDIDNPNIEVGDKVIALTKDWLGGLRKYCVASIKDVWKYNALEPKTAAGLPVNYGHALLSLFRRAKIKKNSVIVVTAGIGGRGLAALDIAANVYKAKVIGVCASSEMADLMREKGAWSAVVLDSESLKASVHEIAGDKGVDIVYETIGGNFLTGAMECVRHEGLVIIGDTPKSEDTLKFAEWYKLPHTFNMTALSLQHYRQFDFQVYRQTVNDVIELCEQNLISPDVGQTFDLEHVNDAIKFLKENKILAKVLIKLPN